MRMRTWPSRALILLKMAELHFTEDNFVKKAQLHPHTNEHSVVCPIIPNHPMLRNICNSHAVLHNHTHSLLTSSFSSSDQ